MKTPDMLNVLSREPQLKIELVPQKQDLALQTYDRLLYVLR